MTLWVQELDCDWQQAASSVLVAVGKQFINQVMEEVLSRFQPGVLPHSSVLHTLASLSVSNGKCHRDVPEEFWGLLRTTCGSHLLPTLWVPPKS